MMPYPFNFVSVLTATIASWVLGMVWYSPVMFGKQWRQLTKIDPQKGDMKKDLPKIFITSFVANLVTAFVLSLFIDMTLATTVIEAMLVGFWAWLGFVAAILITGVIYEKKPFGLYIINVGYQLAAFLVMSIALSLWP